MKTCLKIALGCASLFAAGAVAQAQYAIHWSTIDAGGGVCSGGNFTLNSTVGQPDASPASTGGSVVLTGGFWTGTTELGPTLKIVRSGGSVIVSWPASAVGFRLEHCDALGRSPQVTRWTSNTSTAFTFGDDRVVVEPATGVARYYRLVKP